MPVGELHARWWQVGAREAVLAMNFGQGLQTAEQRPWTAGMNGHFGPPSDFAEPSRISMSVLYRHITADCRDHPDIECCPRSESQKNSNRIVLAWIGVDDQGPKHVTFVRH